MIKALKQPQLQRLWVGQAFSSVGDEIYRVGLTWFAVNLMGSNTGYLAAGQTASLMLLSFIGGKWADRWNPHHTMFRVDLIRMVIVLIPVLISFFTEVPLSLLIVMALVLSALSAFFDPATQATIPLLAKDIETLQSTNGLMGTTIRGARMVGPAVVGLLAAVVPMIHFFTIDAITFLISALSVKSLKKYLPEHVPSPKMRIGFTDAVMSGFRLIQGRQGMMYVFISRALTSGAWNLSIIVGFALLIHQVSGGDARMFGLVMASYGVGNLTGALYFGNRSRAGHKLLWLMYVGYLLWGVGIAAVGMAPTVAWITVASIFTGFMGPLNDLAFIDLMQRTFAVSDLTKVFRLRMALESLGTLVFTLASPWLIQISSIRVVMVGCGVVWIVCGGTGLLLKTSPKSL
ncbi:MFS transporter [Bdellovibrio sp. SKB1291214]|uniref:MFS transporter n=1 Tax=Bdellovibrio sp. SKB1291214 TaxID=1732569 RepID=UPI000B5186AD|nr:MFS transporter [Bdellovibrio sp. SKB1291214]UYL10153.1 MFS transporter [Bdellovibrio sp. SKB1291214]